MRMENTDWQLLRKYAEQDSQEAFAELLRRHMDLVYCAYLRELNRPELAEEATQAVFLILARKASTLRPKPGGAALSTWLFETAVLASRNLRRQERRRVVREQEAMRMQRSETNEAVNTAVAEPLLNDALLALSAGQCDLVIERFFEERSLAEIGVAHGISEDAARMRINRAVERLKRFFGARGVVLSTAAVAAALAQAVRPAPVRCAEAILHAALSKSHPSAISHEAQSLVQGAIRTMKLKRTLAQAGAVAIVAIISLRVANAVRVPESVKSVSSAAPQATLAPIAVMPKGQGDPAALALLDRMYATYAAMHSFRCNVTSRETPLHSDQDAQYEFERPNKVRFRRFTLLGSDMSGSAAEVSDGSALYVICTENHGFADRYAKIALYRGNNAFWFTDFGGLPLWGTEAGVGMPDVALGVPYRTAATPQISAPVYTLGKPVAVDLPSFAYPQTLDVVIGTSHWLTPVGSIKDDPEVVTYYIGPKDHLLYKFTGAYKFGPTEWDTRTETYGDVEVNPQIDPNDFVFKPVAGSKEVSSSNDLLPDRQR